MTKKALPEFKCSLCDRFSVWVEQEGMTWVRYCSKCLPKENIERMTKHMSVRGRIRFRQVLGSKGNPHV